jgi:hypothetical protein
MLEIPRRKLLGMTMAVFSFFTTQSVFRFHPSALVFLRFPVSALSPCFPQVSGFRPQPLLFLRFQVSSLSPIFINFILPPFPYALILSIRIGMAAR